ncbi:hypothetical protein like AT3G16060 [Hibiscus trionum]|uniref:Uncharacterized protein n=1 Tax=Hibiscus trionum TaxID=183268 RepID=A0A9W7LUG8_HIBTR|nr:hypothetical protein like AT3G16060 [Hibiscus trionum]GMI78034.1 hypothetical protein like AT3G16060 [Hibiscus trionum]
MNGMGRQGRRSGASGLQVHHQRQYSDNFLETTSNGRWLQSSGLQHLHPSNNSIPPLQDYAFYGGGGGDGGGQGSRIYRNVQRDFSMGNDFFDEPMSPPVSSRPLNRWKNGEESPNEFSPGLLDLHSFDTELLPQMPVANMYNGPSLYNPVRGRSFDDSEPYISNNKQTGRAGGVPDSCLLKSFAADKEKVNSVAKIKVVVCLTNNLESKLKTPFSTQLYRK